MIFFQKVLDFVKTMLYICKIKIMQMTFDGIPRLIDFLAEKYGNDIIVVPDMDDAVIGICEKSNMLIYSKQRCIDILMVKFGFDYEISLGYYEINIRDKHCNVIFCAI